MCVCTYARTYVQCSLAGECKYFLRRVQTYSSPRVLLKSHAPASSLVFVSRRVNCKFSTFEKESERESESMSVLSENNVQSATNCAFSLREKEKNKSRERERKRNCQHKQIYIHTYTHTYTHTHTYLPFMLLCELSVHRALSRYIPSSVISLKLGK